MSAESVDVRRISIRKQSFFRYWDSLSALTTVSDCFEKKEEDDDDDDEEEEQGGGVGGDEEKEEQEEEEEQEGEATGASQGFPLVLFSTVFE